MVGAEGKSDTAWKVEGDANPGLMDGRVAGLGIAGTRRGDQCSRKEKDTRYHCVSGSASSSRPTSRASRGAEMLGERTEQQPRAAVEGLPGDRDLLVQPSADCLAAVLG